MIVRAVLVAVLGSFLLVGTACSLSPRQVGKMIGGGKGKAKGKKKGKSNKKKGKSKKGKSKKGKGKGKGKKAP